MKCYHLKMKDNIIYFLDLFWFLICFFAFCVCVCVFYGSEIPNNHLGCRCKKKPANNGIPYQMVSRILPSTVFNIPCFCRVFFCIAGGWPWDFRTINRMSFRFRLSWIRGFLVFQAPWLLHSLLRNLDLTWQFSWALFGVPCLRAKSKASIGWWGKNQGFLLARVKCYRIPKGFAVDLVDVIAKHCIIRIVIDTHTE